MANFNTHVGVALGASSLMAIMVANAGLISVVHAPWFVSLGVVGGMLPDIDAANSRPFKKLFMGLALWGGSAVWFFLEGRGEQCLRILATLAIFIVIRYFVAYVFQKMTVHRGVFHSLLAGCFFALSLICASHYMVNMPIIDAWLGGIFLLFGYLVHLFLDELFSVDLANGRIKKSFGTALKIYGYQNGAGSFLLLILSNGLLIVAPSFEPLWKACRSVDWMRVTDKGSLLGFVL